MNDAQATNLDQKRKLGDEWEDWDGKDGFGDSKTSSWMYLALFLTILVSFNAGLHLMLYLVEPRFYSFHRLLPQFSLFFVLAINIFSAAFLGYILLACYTSLVVVNIPFFQKLFFGPLAFITFFLGKQLSLSKDKMGNSFIRGSNRLMSIPRSKNGGGKTMILLPRCLKADVLKEIKAKAEENNFEIAIVDGGSRAREKVKSARPDNIIAVACERDLLSGILDIAPKVRVYGIPNQRPEGPCKNTIIPMDEFNALLSKCACRSGEPQ